MLFWVLSACSAVEGPAPSNEVAVDASDGAEKDAVVGVAGSGTDGALECLKLRESCVPGAAPACCAGTSCWPRDCPTPPCSFECGITVGWACSRSADCQTHLCSAGVCVWP